MECMRKKITIYTDGGSRGNPGYAGAGAVMFDEHGTKLHETSEYLGVKTNNYAEYRAVILGLDMIRKKFGKDVCKTLDVTVRMDSELVCKQLKGEYQIKEETLFPLFIEIHNLLISVFQNVRFEHVPREKNKEADRLANEAMDKVKN